MIACSPPAKRPLRCKLPPSLVIACVVCAALVVAGGTARAEEADQTAIRASISEQAAAWNRHDARAYAALFTPDAEVVNVQGWWWRGRAEIESRLSRGFAYVFRESRLKITEVSVRLLQPGLAVAHVRWTMEGSRPPPGAPNPPVVGIMLEVLRKEGAYWQVQAFQNTNSLPERPFPEKGP